MRIPESERQNVIVGVSDRLAWLPSVTALLAFLCCNGPAALGATLSAVGITMVPEPHFQAAAITLFAALTGGFVSLRHELHRNFGPPLMAGIGMTLVIGTMYVSFNKLVESLGLLMLIAAASWSWSRASSCRGWPG